MIVDAHCQGRPRPGLPPRESCRRRIRSGDLKGQLGGSFTLATVNSAAAGWLSTYRVIYIAALAQ